MTTKLYPVPAQALNAIYSIQKMNIFNFCLFVNELKLPAFICLQGISPLEFTNNKMHMKPFSLNQEKQKPQGDSVDKTKS